MYKVIIIEDDPMVASINKQYVELTSSFHVEATFKNGILALQYLQNCTVDLVILDYYTPQMNGDEFIDQLHAAGMTPAIIMVTSANDAETVRRLISRGVTDYLVKPFEYDRFKAALERFAKRQEELKTSASASDLGQAEIDRLFSVPDVSSQSAPLTKGLNERTLGLIRLFLSEHPEEVWSSEQISEQVHFSRITVRRYLNYLVETNELVSMIDYQTGGRPSIKYRYSVTVQ